MSHFNTGGAFIAIPEESSKSVNHVEKANIKSIEKISETGNDYKDGDGGWSYGLKSYEEFDLDNYNLYADDQIFRSKGSVSKQ